MKQIAKQKLYCYVDETGQDTGGKLFLVSIVITSSQKEKLRNRISEIEQVSGKKLKKWTKATRDQRRKYMEAIIAERDFANNIFYSEYRDTRAYVDLTILTTAKSLLGRASLPYQATVFVDGLNRTERHRFSAGLRQLRVSVRKVRGLRDQSDEFIRLADAIAGFARDVLEGDQIMKPLYKKAERNRIIQKNK